MTYQYARTPATTERLISRIVLVGMAVALAALMAVLVAQDTKAASDLAYFRDGALKDALPATQMTESDKHPNLPHDARRDAARIQFDEDNWLLLDPATSDVEQLQTRDSAWIQFVEDNTMLPSAANASSYARYDTADRIAALGSDVIDFSLGIDYYRNLGQNNDQVVPQEIAGSTPDW